MKALGQASGALEALAALLPDEAEIVDERGTPATVQAHELEPGMLVLVRSGGRVPADGTVEEGTAEFDESMITGESQPVAEGCRRPVVAGTVATDSSVRVRVTAVGEDTTLAGIRRLVTEAQASQVAGSDARRPSRGRAVLRRGRLPPCVTFVSGRFGRHGPSGGANSDGARDRLPARARACDPSGHRDLHVGRRQGRASSSRIGSRSSGCVRSRRSSSTRRER